MNVKPNQDSGLKEGRESPYGEEYKHELVEGRRAGQGSLGQIMRL